jgi:hypothetical protein
VKGQKKYTIWYILASFLSVYAHIYSLLIIISQIVSLPLLPKKHFKNNIKSFLVIGACLIPLFIAPSSRSGQVDWMLDPTIRTLIGSTVMIFGDFIPLLLFFLITVFLFFPWRQIKKWQITFLLITTLFPIVSPFTFSIFFKNIYQSVYSFIILPYAMALIALCVNNIKNLKIQKLFILTIILGLSFRLYFWYAQTNLFKPLLSNVNTGWRESTNYIVSNAKPGDGIIFYSYFGKLPYTYYAKSNVPAQIEISEVPYETSMGIHLPNPDLHLISGFTYPNVWLLENDYATAIPTNAKQFDLVIRYLEKNYQLTELTEFYELKVKKYKFIGSTGSN